MESNINFSLDDYLIRTGWRINNKIWKKGSKSLSILNNGLMIVLNNKIGVKHKHIVTCELPTDFVEADLIFKKCRLNFNKKEDDTENKY